MRPRPHAPKQDKPVSGHYIIAAVGLLQRRLASRLPHATIRYNSLPDRPQRASPANGSAAYHKKVPQPRRAAARCAGYKRKNLVQPISSMRPITMGSSDHTAPPKLKRNSAMSSAATMRGCLPGVNQSIKSAL